MKLYYAQSNDGGVLCFRGIPVICNNPALLRALMDFDSSEGTPNGKAIYELDTDLPWVNKQDTKSTHTEEKKPATSNTKKRLLNIQNR